MPTLAIAIDLYQFRWDTPGGELWLALLPQIRADEQLVGVAALARPEDFTYRILRPDLTDPLEPLPLPTGLNPHLRIHRAGGVVTELVIPRRSGARITDPLLFQQLNRRPKDWVENDDSKIKPVATEPFAKAYNLALAEQLAAAPETIRGQLQIGLVGGTKRRISGLVASDLGHLMILDNPEPGVIETNLHSLLGLMVQLGTKSALAELQSIENIELVFDKEGGGDIPTDLGSVPTDTRFFTDYFSNLTSSPPNVQLGEDWSSAFATRVYANDAPTTTTAAVRGGVVYHQLTPLQPDGGQLGDKDAPLTRLEVRPETGGSPPTAGSTITMNFWSSMRCRLAPYRRFPVDPRRPNVLLRLSPEHGEEERFRAALRADPSAFFNARLVDSNNRLAPSGSLRPIGVYQFAWDGGDATPTVLFLGLAPETWGTPPAGPSVIAFIQLQRNGLPITATLRAEGLDPIDPLGPRWETTSPPLLLRADFDMVEPSPPLPARAGVGVFFERDVEFDFAQSASHIEGLLTIDYPMGGGGGSTSDDDYLDDLINHNALNIFERRSGQWVHLNPDSQTYPVYNQGHDSGAPMHVFHIRQQDRVDVPRADGAIGEDPRGFLRELYNRLGTQRSLKFDIEHRYGATLGLGMRPTLSTYADWPPFLPSDAQLKTSREDLRLLRVSLADPTTAELHFSQAVLDWLLVTDPERWALNLAAWRAIAELSQAAEIWLAGDFRRFDVNAGLAATDSKGALVSALQRVEAITKTEWEITTEVQRLVTPWLSNPPAADPPPLLIPLTTIGSVDDLCTCCSFSLRVVRRNGVAPNARRQWTPVRYDRSITSAADQFGSEGLVVREAPDANDRLDAHLVTLKSRSGELTPTANEIADAEVFRRVTGLGGQWIVPVGIIQPDPGAIRAAIVPVSFRPVARDPALGWKTELVLTQLLAALQEVLDISPLTWASTWDHIRWRAFFEGLQVNERKVAALLAAPVGLAYPLPEPTALPNDAQDVANSISKLKDANDPLAKTMKAWLQVALLAKPALFADAKALLVNHLRSDSGSQVPADLYQLSSNKELSPDGAPPVFDTDAYTFVQAADVQDGVSFVEDLDNARYGTAFRFKSYQLPTFESVVEELQKPEANGSYTTARGTVPLAALVAPTGVEDLSGANRRNVWLASRAPVQDPVWVRSRVMEADEQEPIEDGEGDLFSLDSVLACRPTPAVPGQTGVRLRVRSAAWGQSPYLDDFAALVLFSIRGNEETDWKQAFQEDEFFVFAEASDGLSKRRPATTPVPTADTFALDFFDVLQGATDLKSVSDLDRAVDARILDRATAMFQPAAPPSLPALDNQEPLTIVVGIVGNQIEIPTDSPVRGAYLFQVEEANPAQSNLGYFLLLAVELPIWQRHTVSMIQTRNRREFEPGSRFAEVFGQASEKVSAEAPLAATRSHNLIGRTPLHLNMTERSLPIEDLVTRLVGDELNPAGSAWKDFDLSALVSHEQLVVAPIAHPGMLDGSSMVSRSGAPITNHRFTGGAMGGNSRVTFDRTYDNFLVDLQWRSPSNLQFFRLGEYRVTFN